MKPEGKQKRKMLWTLFWTSMRISAFTFGGGFVIVTLMKRVYVDRLGWISEEEMLDYTALAQTAPGPIAVNAAVLVGRHVAGGWGMAAAVLGTVLPPIALLLLVSLVYDAFAANRYVALFLRGMQAGVAAVICDVVCSLGVRVLREKNWVSYVLTAAAFVLSFVLRVSAAWIVLGALAVGIVLALLDRRKPA